MLEHGARREAPSVVIVGATGRLVRLSVVAVELGLGDLACRNLMKKLGVEVRSIGKARYVMLFALERALWRWFALSEDLALFEFAYRAYESLERRGLERHLKNIGLKRLRYRLKDRALKWANLTELSKLEHAWKPRMGRPRKPVAYVRTVLTEAGIAPLVGPSLAADPALAAVAESPNVDIPDDGSPCFTGTPAL